MKNAKGFTLLEVLVVLSASLLLLSIGSIIHTNILQNYQKEQFFRLFQSDLLHMQQITFIKREMLYLTIQPDQHNYIIRRAGTGKTIVKRDIPNNWHIQLVTLSMPISYTYSGTIKNPGMFTIKTDDSQYDVYFPFGKGRNYVVEY
ncbi:prepilin-type N-terminal cleavage/methylation domain-containing protein [Aquibacillus halophilus]|uniref:Prepilin-type N-terminal cleavage/methylation domain-containing protein n=1 Tax=Aquibacillus halophilus TaxID=930132 RepID=A0A6A8DJI9_9BACI|nr:competence type IV pilus minor pilin ComGD [Aquibacillus halophilus]MRH43137.1 prepilin-type N-terminal cleavage/methylation domain-containing protein [Aquibacillus halophilus]